MVATRTGGVLDLLGFVTEPDCWRPFVDQIGGRAILKPDGYLRAGIGAYEDRLFLESDLGTRAAARW
jgi:hypothetical protein